ncbi:Glutathione synthetase [Candidatus Fokinia solitaria]|uniref:Glutathione synthetase n=1 Tax=Candidatus Fokinia solitaria TaxID=1802984 RepID=A0A2U8BSR2_9RICK|nr:YheC/YheD family protein [Candidatus Fokinia solitaria]AWD33381.1 Glutathione synthetase [Candidatus Fokinia solitaria]
MRKIIAIQGDPLETLKIRTDTSLFLADGLYKNGYEIFWYTVDTMRLSSLNGKKSLCARGYFIKLEYVLYSGTQWSRVSDLQELHLDEVKCILLRQDPPFNMLYITSTFLLEHVDVPIINSPRGVRNNSEKIFPFSIAVGYLPNTIITREVGEILSFLKKHLDVVLKPLYEYSGHGAIRMSYGKSESHTTNQVVYKDDEEAANGIRKYIDGFAEHVVVQAFISAILSGDKRVFVIDGEIVGAFSRIPSSGNFLANIYQGASIAAVKLTDSEIAMCDKIARKLKEDGIFIAGIDLIGDYITEINVTSPTGFVLLEEMYRENAKNDTALPIQERLVKLVSSIIDTKK